MKSRYTIIWANGWGNPDPDTEQAEGDNWAVYDLVTEQIAELDGSRCHHLSKADAAVVLTRLEGCHHHD